MVDIINDNVIAVLKLLCFSYRLTKVDFETSFIFHLIALLYPYQYASVR